MRSARNLTAVAAAGACVIAGGLTLAAAPPASAASDTLNCDAATSPVGYTLTPGETLTITAVGCYGMTSDTNPSRYMDSLSATFSPSLQPDFCSLTVTSGCTGSVAAFSYQLLTVTMVAPAVDQPSTRRMRTYATPEGAGTVEVWVSVVTPPAENSSGAATPPPWLQAYARASRSETCYEGWSPSWAQWPSDGQGGWVCERTVPSER
ncbi:MAG: hypothetical protein GC156_13000 [Actinomycetales bacterium]|nr:hypothetical protein [Actinomycetales bacterium]